MHYVLYKQRIPIRWLLLSLLSFILAACSTTSDFRSVKQFDSSFSYVGSVDISADMTKAELEALYGGQAFIFKPEAGFAILGFSEQEGALTTLGRKDRNQDGLSTPEVSTAGYQAWSGGYTAWSGGYTAWSGGWDSWDGDHTDIPALPSDNGFAWSQIGLYQAQAMSSSFGEGMKVAIIDTGLDLEHPMFQGSLAPAGEWKDFVDGDTYPQDEAGGQAYGHGTAAAGIVLQIAPKVTLLPLRAIKPDGVGDVSDVVSAIDWAIEQNADIINLSLGTNADVAALSTIIDYATNQGVYIVASAGNDGNRTLSYPAAYAKTAARADYMISVGSSNSDSTLSSFSNYSSDLEIAAPGQDIFTAYPDAQIAHVTGTSFAAPQVAAALALIGMDTHVSNRDKLESQLFHSWVMSNGSHHLKLDEVLRNLPDFQPNRQLLFVVGDSGLSSGDYAIKQRLKFLGYNYTIIDDAEVQASHALGMDGILISSSVDSGLVNTTFRDVAVPVMSWKPWLFDDLGMVSASSASYGSVSGQTDVTILPNPHPLTGGLHGYDAYDLTVYSSPGNMTWGVPAATAIKVATLASDRSKSVVFAYNQGDAMISMPAPARRIGFMYLDDSANNANEHWANRWLFDAALTWLVSGN